MLVLLADDFHNANHQNAAAEIRNFGSVKTFLNLNGERQEWIHSLMKKCSARLSKLSQHCLALATLYFYESKNSDTMSAMHQQGQSYDRMTNQGKKKQGHKRDRRVLEEEDGSLDGEEEEQHVGLPLPVRYRPLLAVVPAP